MLTARRVLRRPLEHYAFDRPSEVGRCHACARCRPRPDPVRARRRRRRRPGTATLIAVGVVRTPAGRRHRRCGCSARARDRGLARPAPARRGRGRAGLQPAQRAHGHGHRAGRGGGDRRAPPGAGCRSPCTPRARSRPPSPAAAAPTRPRSRRWSPGCCGSPRGPTPADAADALALAICHLWRGAARGAGWRRRQAGCRAPEASMIASVAGRVAAVGPDGAVVEVGGVGLPCRARPARSPALRVGEQAALATAWSCGRPSSRSTASPTTTRSEVFELLQTASGVGPRLAQAVLAVHDPDDVRRAVATEDLAALCMVPGIGKKGAQRLVLELKDRLGPPAGVLGTAVARRRPRSSRGRTSCTRRCRPGLSGARGRRGAWTRSCRRADATPTVGAGPAAAGARRADAG